MGYIDVSYQAATFGLSLLLGCILCLVYDIVRVLHKTAVKGFFEVLLCDLLFWAVASVLTFCFLMIRCIGAVRGYVLFGEFVGAVITRFTLSRLWIGFFMRLHRISVWIITNIKRLFSKIMSPCKKILKKIIKSLKKVLQHKRRLLYNHLKVRKKNDENILT